ncbi:hypothetical protein [Priestia flexa]
MKLHLTLGEFVILAFWLWIMLLLGASIFYVQVYSRIKRWVRR